MFGSTPVIKLGDQFKKVANYQKRFKSIPSLLELDHLTVSGDVTFGRNVQLRGTVIVVAMEGSRIDIADGSILENSEFRACAMIKFRTSQTDKISFPSLRRARIWKLVNHRPLNGENIKRTWSTKLNRIPRPEKPFQNSKTVRWSLNTTQ